MSDWAAILLSQQHLQPSGSDAWVANTVRALNFVKQQRWGVVSSVGMTTWDLITCKAADLRIPLQLWLASTEQNLTETIERIRREYELPADTDIRHVAGIYGEMSKADRAALRDQAVTEAASHIIPVSIRPGGRLDALLTSVRGTNRQILSHFSVSYDRRQAAAGYTITEDQLSANITSLPIRLFIHWTRAPHAPWPNETIRSYYRDIAAGATYPRSAFDTLRNMLRSRRICASTRHMPRGVATVSFSGLTPSEMAPLMRWRSRYCQMAFEPYGIGIRKEAAFRLGIEPVLYVSDADAVIDPDKRWKCQTKGKYTDWSTEREYRYRGDLDLNTVNLADLVVFCKTKEESEQLSSEFGLSALPMTNE